MDERNANCRSQNYSMKNALKQRKICRFHEWSFSSYQWSTCRRRARARVLESTVFVGWFRGTCRGTRSLAIDTGRPSVGCIFHEGGWGSERTIIRPSYAPFRPRDRRTHRIAGVSVLPHARQLSPSPPYFNLRRGSIDRICLWTRLALSVPYVSPRQFQPHFNGCSRECGDNLRTNDVPRNAAAVRRCGDVTGLFD